MKKLLLFLLALTATVLLADSNIEVPDGDPLAALLSLITSWSALSPLAIGSAVIVIVVQAVKKFFPTFQYMKILVTVCGVAYGTLQAMSRGLSLVDALAFSLLISGGAVAIYELFKNPLNSLAGVQKSA